MGLRLIGLLAGQHDPRDPGELVGKRRRDKPEGLDLGELPDPAHHRRWLVFDVAHDGGGSDDEQSTKVSVALFGDAAKPGFPTG